MPRESSAKDVAIFCGVGGGFVLAVLLSIFFGVSDRLLGVMLIFVGTLALFYSRAVSDAKRSIGEKWPVFPRNATLRPLTVKLWGGGVAILGLLMVVGI